MPSPNPKLMGILLILSLLLILTLINSCASVPPRDVKIFKGSSKDYGIVRAQSKEKISCESVEINKYYCVDKDDLTYMLQRQCN